jgi:3-isopropylmalate/(R)-2-methylmalate dehydratase large subunit
LTIVCGDSHTCTHGRLGAVVRHRRTEIMHVLATQTLRQTKPTTMRIRLDGKLAAGVAAKDVILATISQIGTGAGRGHAVNLRARRSAMSVDQRLTVCNLSIELGAKIGMIAPDDTTYSYLADRPYAPKAEMFDQACAYWHRLPSDDDARFDVEHVIDASKIAPQITWGTSPQDVIAVDQRIPDPSREADPQRRQAMEAALAYMALTPGEEIEGTPIDCVRRLPAPTAGFRIWRSCARGCAGRSRPTCAPGSFPARRPRAGGRARRPGQDFPERGFRMA